MLDLTQIARQMQGISRHLRQEAEAARQRLDQAETVMQAAQSRQADLVAQQQQWRDRLIFTAAEPIEPLQIRPAIAQAPEAHTVIATDGSQISPNHHEIAYCYLINVGRIVLHYGQSRHPRLDSLPEVFYRSEDLYVSRQWGISTEEWMGHRRTVSEAIALAQLATELSQTAPATVPPIPSHPPDPQASLAADLSPTAAPANLTAIPPDLTRSPSDQLALDFPASHLPPASRSPLAAPTVAMVDGSLIYWFLETMPEGARQAILPPILAAWDQLRATGVPLVGYLSASRSGESLNWLRLAQCGYDEPNCLTHCRDRSDRLPCQTLDPLRDVAFWARVLAPGQRSPLWRSAAPILTEYAHHHIYFCYLHVGPEVARVEFPAWVVQDPVLFDSALSLTVAQVQKGFGYPVALAEAHNQAVVRGGDRTRFFALLEREMIRAGLQNVGTSYKEARKRGSIA